ncbi:MAG: hypothetical protein IT493_01730 [Gammaproteobacteria bacterium]|nr:hypothetical protein [Gammaproteobacteria bacterium]
MNDEDDLQRLEGRLAALGAEQSARAAEVETAWRERLTAPGTLLGAAAVGAALGLLGGTNSRRNTRHDPPPVPAPTVTTGGATVLGAIIALAGLAGAVLRIVEIGVIAKSRVGERPRD